MLKKIFLATALVVGFMASFSAGSAPRGLTAAAAEAPTCPIGACDSWCDCDIRR